MSNKLSAQVESLAVHIFILDAYILDYFWPKIDKLAFARYRGNRLEIVSLRVYVSTGPQMFRAPV